MNHGEENSSNKILFHPTNAKIIVTSCCDKIFIWNLEKIMNEMKEKNLNTEEIQNLQLFSKNSFRVILFSSNISSFSFSKDGSKIAVGLMNGVAQIVKHKSKKVI